MGILPFFTFLAKPCLHYHGLVCRLFSRPKLVGFPRTSVLCILFILSLVNFTVGLSAVL